MTGTAAARNLLGIYLNDHLAGATAGAGLAQRMAASAHLPLAESLIRPLAVEISQDRAALLEFMTALDVPVRRYKVWAAWAGEKAGRLKPNGHLVTRSELSNLEELEMLRLGVEGKAAGWRTLRTLASQDRRLDAGRLDKLIEGARRQGELIEELRMSAAEQVIGTSPKPTG